MTSEDIRACRSGNECREQKGEQEARWPGLLFRNTWRIDHTYNRDIFCFLNARNFILLCEQLEDRLLHFDAAIEIRKRNGKPRELPKRGIEFAVLAARRSCAAV